MQFDARGIIFNMNPNQLMIDIVFWVWRISSILVLTFILMEVWDNKPKWLDKWWKQNVCDWEDK